METAITSTQQAMLAANTREPGQDLKMEDFFKLLTVQLTSQDPLKPMEDTEFISQMTGFSSLSEMEGMAKDMKGLRQVQSTFSAQMLIGRQVIATGSNGETIEGTITRIAREGDNMVPYVGEQKVSMQGIKEIF